MLFVTIENYLLYTAAYQRSPHWLVVDLQNNLLYHVQIHSSKGQCDASTRNGVARKHSSHIRVVTITEDHSWIADSGSINGHHYQSSGGERSCCGPAMNLVRLDRSARKILSIVN